MHHSALTVPGLALLVLAGGAAAQQPETARAVLRDSGGRQVGSATLTQTPHGVLLRAELTGVPPGVHGLHVHAVGKCEGPAFTSAGGHFNPHRRQHGLLNAAGPHAGDAPNAHVGSGGAATVEVLFSQASLSQGEGALLDADGAAVVVHAGADDYATDPAGNAGARIACGVIER
jgi:Cu-Zn family superoxide dismutase